ncbi:hypothetical protein L6452_34120 [Arctium lappa]|uniref:Uncharacterized protein n=1 Tax=Arctium lappa TaxID=4217 RepID=A0ACB8YGP5_ARCLA|nr:hypothetical protein L6452_34120 [Arctium lappa]
MPPLMATDDGYYNLRQLNLMVETGRLPVRLPEFLRLSSSSDENSKFSGSVSLLFPFGTIPSQYSLLFYFTKNMVSQMIKRFLKRNDTCDEPLQSSTWAELTHRSDDHGRSQ